MRRTTRAARQEVPGQPTEAGRRIIEHLCGTYPLRELGPNTDKEPCLKSRIAMLESDLRAHAKSHDQHVAEIMKLADRLRRVIYATGVDVETE